MKAYEACLNATSTHHAPWYVVPADDKENARLIVSQIVLDALNDLKMAYPKTTAKRRRELKVHPQAAREVTVELWPLNWRALPRRTRTDPYLWIAQPFRDLPFKVPRSRQASRAMKPAAGSRNSVPTPCLTQGCIPYEGH